MCWCRCNSQVNLKMCYCFFSSGVRTVLGKWRHWTAHANQIPKCKRTVSEIEHPNSVFRPCETPFQFGGDYSFSTETDLQTRVLRHCCFWKSVYSLRHCEHYVWTEFTDDLWLWHCCFLSCFNSLFIEGMKVNVEVCLFITLSWVTGKVVRPIQSHLYLNYFLKIYFVFGHGCQSNLKK